MQKEKQMAFDRNFGSGDSEIRVSIYTNGADGFTQEVLDWMKHFIVHTFWAKYMGNCYSLVAVKTQGLKGHEHIPNENPPEGYSEIL